MARNPSTRKTPYLLPLSIWSVRVFSKREPILWVSLPFSKSFQQVLPGQGLPETPDLQHHLWGAVLTESRSHADKGSFLSLSLLVHPHSYFHTYALSSLGTFCVVNVVIQGRKQERYLGNICHWILRLKQANLEIVTPNVFSILWRVHTESAMSQGVHCLTGPARSHPWTVMLPQCSWKEMTWCQCHLKDGKRKHPFIST